MSPTELAYRKTAVEGASGFGLMISLYDTLAGDLRRGAEADRSNDLERRLKELNHALLVVAYLEDWVRRGSGGELADQLMAFYTSMRRKIVQAQAKRSPEILEQQMAQVLSIREIWQKFEIRGSSTATEVPSWVQTPRYPGTQATQYERSASSWSA